MEKQYILAVRRTALKIMRSDEVSGLMSGVGSDSSRLCSPRKY